MSATVETMQPFGLNFYAGLCGWTLARAHARSGDPIAMAAYLGDRRRIRPVDHRFLGALRGSERQGLPGVYRGGVVRQDRGRSGRLRSQRSQGQYHQQPEGH